MNKIALIAWREIKAYFTSWLAYALLAGWLLMVGMPFILTAQGAARGGNFALNGIFGNMLVMLLLVVPLITMRLVAEERNLGTLELLFTSPITEWQVAAGKFFGAWGFVLIMLVATSYVPFLSTHYGSIETGPVWGGYVGLACCGAVFAAFGVLCSSLTSSQVVAGFLAFGGMIFSWMLAWPAQVMQDNNFAAFAGNWSVFLHATRMLEGAVDTKDLVFFVSLTVFCLFSTVRVLESRKWN